MVPDSQASHNLSEPNILVEHFTLGGETIRASMTSAIGTKLAKADILTIPADIH
jgi:hypothetical protein